MPTHILLYHATFATVPKDLSRRLHNVAPVELYRQLSWLRRRFRFISIDEWLESRNRRGTAVVTFDDAYKCVFEEALPVLETLGIPATVFINGITLEGKNQWRDKVRYLISHSLVAEFLEWLPEEYANLRSLKLDNFYRETKSANLNSKLVDSAIDEYAKCNGLELSQVYCVDTPKYLVSHPLIDYGNHTYNHYVMSALTPDEQSQEIKRNHDLIISYCGSICSALSIPFGGSRDFNRATLDIAREHGYRTCLLTRNRLDGTSFSFDGQAPATIERYMPPATLELHRRLALELTYLEPARRRARILMNRFLDG